MKTNTMVFMVSELYADEEKVILGQRRDKAGEVKRFGTAFLSQAWLNALPLAYINDEKVFFTRDRKPGYGDMILNWKIEFPPSVLQELRSIFYTNEGDLTPLGETLNEPVKSNGIPVTQGIIQLHIDVLETGNIENEDGKIVMRNGIATGVKFYSKDEPEYLTYGETVNIGSFMEEICYGRDRHESRVAKTPEEVKTVLSRLMTQKPSRKARAAFGRVSDVQTPIVSASTPDTTPVSNGVSNEVAEDDLWSSLAKAINEPSSPTTDAPQVVEEEEDDDVFSL